MYVQPPHQSRSGRRSGRRRASLLAVGIAVAVTVASCGSAAPTETTAPPSAASTQSAGADQQTVTLLTHDSFSVDPDLLASFEKSSGITVKVLAQGDAGEMLSKAILTKENPLGDAIFGIDNTFASKAIDAGILEPYTSPLADHGSAKYQIGDDSSLTAIDFGDVCVNIDHTYFADHNLAEPVTLDDLVKPEYKDLFVTEDAATSSPGLSFLLATIGHFGVDGWQDYWKSLKDNGIKVDSGWTDAYGVDFSGSAGKGTRPLVVSYASSPPSEVPEGSDTAPTGALLETCFRQVEYAGVLTGAKNPAGAQQVIDFLLSEQFQEQIPGQMWMYPVDSSVSLPADWATFAPVAEHPHTVDPADIESHREEWINQWSDLMQG